MLFRSHYKGREQISGCQRVGDSGGMTIKGSPWELYPASSLVLMEELDVLILVVATQIYKWNKIS